MYETAHDILSLIYDRVSAQDMCAQEALALHKVRCTGGALVTLTAGMAFAPQAALFLGRVLREPLIHLSSYKVYG